MKTLSPDHPDAGGYEADMSGWYSPFEEPVDPPLHWSEWERYQAKKAGIDLAALGQAEPMSYAWFRRGPGWVRFGRVTISW